MKQLGMEELSGITEAIIGAAIKVTGILALASKSAYKCLMRADATRFRYAT